MGLVLPLAAIALALVPSILHAMTKVPLSLAEVDYLRIRMDDVYTESLLFMAAATLLGNPQNMLIGGRLKLSFSGYLLEAAIPVLLGLCVVWAVIVWRSREFWTLASE